MKKIINWIAKTFTDDKGAPSSKRQMAFLAFGLLVYIVVKDKSVDMMNIVKDLIIILLGITGVEKFTKLKK